MNYSQYDKIASKYDTLFRDEMSLVENREVGKCSHLSAVQS